MWLKDETLDPQAPVLNYDTRNGTVCSSVTEIGRRRMSTLNTRFRSTPSPDLLASLSACRTQLIVDELLNHGLRALPLRLAVGGVEILSACARING